jgi:predicted N-acetyltransferase YhbS
MEILIRRAVPADFPVTEFITREAFWNVYKPGCNEHLVLHNLRNSNSYIPELDLVAVVDNNITGHIISSRARIVDSLDQEQEVLCVGPVSVLPELQAKGIGSVLMHHSIARAKELGFRGMILFGNPGYYHRFGFSNAEAWHITTKDGQNFEPFMALELQTHSLASVNGRFIEDEAFEPGADELDEFEKNFPFKEKRITDTQLPH